MYFGERISLVIAILALIEILTTIHVHTSYVVEMESKQKQRNKFSLSAARESLSTTPPLAEGRSVAPPSEPEIVPIAATPVPEPELTACRHWHFSLQKRRNIQAKFFFSVNPPARLVSLLFVTTTMR